MEKPLESQNSKMTFGLLWLEEEPKKVKLEVWIQVRDKPEPLNKKAQAMFSTKMLQNLIRFYFIY